MVDHYQNILVAVDESEQAKQAFQEAVAIAKRNKGTLSVCAVVDTSHLWGDGYNIETVLNAQKDAAELLVTILKNSYCNDYPIQCIVEVGTPKHVLTQTLPEKNNYDLIVMGATGKGQLQRMLLGSTTSYVVTNAPCNVMVVR